MEKKNSSLCRRSSEIFKYIQSNSMIVIKKKSTILAAQLIEDHLKSIGARKLLWENLDIMKKKVMCQSRPGFV